MDAGFAKILAFIVFIALGWTMRRFGLLKPEAFYAVSALVLYVTLPCVTMTGLNGMQLGSAMGLMALGGFCSNLFFFGVATLLTLRTKNPQTRDFSRLNISGFSIGPFAVPYVQAFLPPSGLITALMFDVGNSFMAAGGTYAIISGMREHTPPARMAKLILGKMSHSGPILAFVFMMILAALGLKLPSEITAITSLGAAANTFLCMIMIGESISISLTKESAKTLFGVLAARFVLQCILAAFFWNVMPLDAEARKALVLCAFAPVPAMNLIYTSELKGDLGMAANLSSLSIAVAIAAMSAAATLL